MDGGNASTQRLPLSGYYYIPPQPPLPYVNQTKTLVTSKGYPYQYSCEQDGQMNGEGYTITGWKERLTQGTYPEG